VVTMRSPGVLLLVGGVFSSRTAAAATDDDDTDEASDVLLLLAKRSRAQPGEAGVSRCSAPSPMPISCLAASRFRASGRLPLNLLLRSAGMFNVEAARDDEVRVPKRSLLLVSMLLAAKKQRCACSTSSGRRRLMKRMDVCTLQTSGYRSLMQPRVEDVRR
jgi:hypothetical protein